jgi:hypothetical protein
MTYVTYHGEQYEVADRIGLMPLMRFAHLARSGVDADDMEGLDAMYALLRQCFTDEAWNGFEDAATRHRADGDELLAVVKDAIEVISERPTPQPSDSSDGQTPTPENSAGDSSSRVLSRLEGRPDLQLAVLRAQEAQAS